MTIFDMLEQSGILTLLGMGIVFGFLILMIIAMTLAGKAIRALGLDKDLLPPPVKPAVQPSGGKTAAGITAAITAAVHEYRNTEKR